jgi:hypothetical protein
LSAQNSPHESANSVGNNGWAMNTPTTSTLAAALWDFDGTLADT